MVLPRLTGTRPGPMPLPPPDPLPPPPPFSWFITVSRIYNNQHNLRHSAPPSLQTSDDAGDKHTGHRDALLPWGQTHRDALPRSNPIEAPVKHTGTPCCVAWKLNPTTSSRSTSNILEQDHPPPHPDVLWSGGCPRALRSCPMSNTSEVPAPKL